ncbi:MAG: hypothetical protein WC560_01125 [Syntrophales bacterium]
MINWKSGEAMTKTTMKNNSAERKKPKGYTPLNLEACPSFLIAKILQAILISTVHCAVIRHIYYNTRIRFLLGWGRKKLAHFPALHQSLTETAYNR